MKKKCPKCNSCLDYGWIGPHMVLHCWLDKTYYRLISGSVVELTNEEFELLRKDEDKVNNEPKQSI